MRSPTVIFTLFFCILSVQSQSGNEHGSTCVISEDELLEMKEYLSGLCDQESTEYVIGCEKLLTATVGSVNSLKTVLSTKIQETDATYSETEKILKLNEQRLTEELEEIPSKMQEKFMSDIDDMTNDMMNLHKLIGQLFLEQEKYEADSRYYTDYLDNGTKFVKRYDLDSFFEEAKKCTFRPNRVQMLINGFNEMFTLAYDDSSKALTNECFSELRQKITNLEEIFKHRVGKNKIESLKSTYEERSKLLRKLIDDYTLQNEQQGMQNLTVMSDKYQALKLEYESLKVETKKMRKQAAYKGFLTLKKMILEGTKYRKARDIFLNIRGTIKNPYPNILNKTYDCEPNNLYSTIRFAYIFSRFTGYAIIRDKMKDCGQLTSPFILEIASITKDETLKETIGEVYETWVSQIQNGQYAKIEEAIKILDDGVISFRKLFQIALKSNPTDIKSLLAFVDNLGAYEQKVVIDLYDEMMEQNLAFTLSHFEIVKWIHNKLYWISQQLPNSAITGDLQEHLDLLLEKIPSALRTFIFEASFILATKDNAILMRSDSHNGVKFKAIPDRSGKFYRFEDLRYEKAFYATKFTDVKSKEEKIRVRLGSENTDNYYWSLKSSDQQGYFYLENKQFTGFFLSSEENNVCMQKNFWGSCNKKEWMNRVDSRKLSITEWTFTTRLIRNGLLPDRAEG